MPIEEPSAFKPSNALKYLTLDLSARPNGSRMSQIIDAEIFKCVILII